IFLVHSNIQSEAHSGIVDTTDNITAYFIVATANVKAKRNITRDKNISFEPVTRVQIPAAALILFLDL
ncbi:MAG: hypothetical protein OWQ52_09675, partial [Metallosphaera prunae]|uniref:hypothetical protein n=1 Tax=Metallosphaera prunae TaxID=47304 RepID=UPI0022723CF6